ncbi:MAG TPA: hypothetical protein VHV79_11135 [Mycobacteriales bacterium]|nr:hypothetical protein [Mycobacteriales bacterium]
MALDASEVLGSQQLAGTLVNPRGMLHKVMTQSNAALGWGVSGPLAGMFLKKNIDRERVEAAASTAPDFGDHGYLALTADEIVLLTTKKGLMSAKPAAVLARVPRVDIAGVTLGDGMGPGLSLLFDDGQAWSFDVTPATKKGAKALVDALSAAG